MEPITKSKSRNVNAYLKAEMKYQKLRQQAELARAVSQTKYRRLTGGQLAEALRILSEVEHGEGGR